MIDLHHANALEFLGSEVREFQLCYIDPPFNTGRIFTSADGEIAYRDRWTSRAHYLRWLTELVDACWARLLPTGCLIVHVDPSVSHYVKVCLDNCLGEFHFASEIIWRYRRWPAKTNNFQAMHDVLLRYVKVPGASCFNVQYEPLAPSTVKTFGRSKQQAQFLRGSRVRSITGNDESPGAPLSDVWDIGIIAPRANERTGYPTQKPEKLMRRIIECCTNVGDLVLDPCCGSGTTLAVAQQYGRNAVGIDNSSVAIKHCKTRLGALLSPAAAVS